MSKIVYLILCVMCAQVALAAGLRFKRASGTSSSGSTSSSSSSSSSSGSSSNSGSYSSGGIGNPGGASNFMFPTSNYPFNSFQGGFPFQDFNSLFQQFLASLSAAQAYAAQNPSYAALFNQQIQSLMAQQQAAMAQFPLAFPGVDSNTITPDVRTSGANPVFSSAHVNYGPQGGYGQAASFPGGSDGLGVRIAEDFGPPSGGSFGVFTSSSSGTSDVNGKRTSFKTSTFGTNDNGKITFRTINE